MEGTNIINLRCWNCQGYKYIDNPNNPEETMMCPSCEGDGVQPQRRGNDPEYAERLLDSIFSVNKGIVWARKELSQNNYKDSWLKNFINKWEKVSSLLHENYEWLDNDKL
tara:strand:+ start:119 stop:448 length:330 start_codon:yes stop_codon:yes gene_type:complete